MDLAKFGLPKEAAEGRWFDYVHPITGKIEAEVRMKIASSDTDEYRLHLANTLRRYSNESLRSSRNKNVLPTTTQEEQATVAAMARYVLLDFQGIEVDGVPLNGSSIEDREMVLIHALVREFVIEQSQTIAQTVLEDGELKNSQSGQPGITVETTQSDPK